MILRKTLFFVYLLISTSLIACNSSTKPSADNEAQFESDLQREGLKTAYFASGCFWCVEAIFQSVKGVEEAVSGYAGGEEKDPTYDEVSSGRTSHAEAVKVYYDPDKIDFKTLIRVFFGSHDPTTLNRQGPDRGAQYRSIAFYQNEAERSQIESYVDSLEKAEVYEDPIVTEIEPLENFYKAEEYHQEYEKNHPENPYVQSVSIPRLKRFQKKFPELLKENH